jgi:hypothetical protein
VIDTGSGGSRGAGQGYINSGHHGPYSNKAVEVRRGGIADGQPCKY